MRYHTPGLPVQQPGFKDDLTFPSVEKPPRRPGSPPGTTRKTAATT